MKGWDDALEAQNELRASFHTVKGAKYLQAFERSLDANGKMFRIEGHEVQSAHGDPISASHAVASAVATVEMGIPMWVAGEVVDLVEYAAETWRAEALMPDHLFTMNAVFAYLERPLATIDRHGRTCKFRAISWSLAQYADNPGKRGVVFSLWSHCDDDDDYSADLGVRLIGGSHLSLMHSSTIPFGDEEVMREHGTRAMSVQFQVMMRLAQQEVIVPGHERASRPVWRRKSNWRQIKEVNVLRLRRAKPPKYEGPEREVEWSHRWMVGLGTGGFWRNQWYPKLQQHCQIWIMPYVKGPPDAPLVLKKSAIEFTR